MSGQRKCAGESGCVCYKSYGEHAERTIQYGVNLNLPNAGN